MQIQISWLLQKPTDLDLHCLQRQSISGFSRTRVKIKMKHPIFAWCTLSVYDLTCLVPFFSRSPSKRYARRTIGGITRNVILDEKNTIDGYRNIPKSQTFSGSSHHSSYHSSFHRYDGTSNHQRATLPHDYKIGNSSQISLHSEKSDE